MVQPHEGPGVAVRAWIYGRPIFYEEVICLLPSSEVRRLRDLPPSQQASESRRVLDLITDTLIDQELLVQDMMRKLEMQPNIWEKYKGLANRDAEKKIYAQMRANHMNTVQELDDALNKQGSSIDCIKRVIEREFLSTLYLRGRIEPYWGKIDSEQIREYYDQHINEFQQPDRVKWQNIFIAVGPKHPTLADARDFAGHVLAQWRGGTDIIQLLEFDDGEARAHKGDGVGELRGQIRPRELEPYLFTLKDGEFGEPIELADRHSPLPPGAPPVRRRTTV